MSVAEEEIAGGPITRAERRIVTIALMLAMAVAALEQLVVSTAMPTIIAQLRGFDIYPWVASAYLLASTITVPLYAKMADLWGRRRVLLVGLGLFSLGSILSGAATSMPMLIAMRTIQGLGAGAVGPIVLTMIGDLYSLEERAKVQGLFSGIWGISSVAGPAIGGVLTYYLSWRWVFFVTVPFSAVACWILWRHVRETVGRPTDIVIDWAGAALIASGSTGLLLAALGAQERPWPTTAGLLAGSAVLLVLFVLRERVAHDPVLPLDLFAARPILVGVIGSLMVGGLLFAVDTYVPLYVQGVLGANPLETGRAITPMFLSWSISVAVAAKLVVRLGFRKTALTGAVLIAAGASLVLLGAQRPGREAIFFAAGLVVMGLGMGPNVLCYTLAAQNAVDWGRRGVATGVVLFSRTMGGALLVGLLGASLAAVLARQLADAGAGGIDVTAALRPEDHALLSAAELDLVRSSLRAALRTVFALMAVVAGVGLLCAAMLPGGRATTRPSSAAVDDATLAEIAG